MRLQHSAQPALRDASDAAREMERKKAKSAAMAIGQKIRRLREEKGLSQGDIERTTGMLRGYISRVEHGHTVPSLETLERFAGALNVPLYQLFCNPDEPLVDQMAPTAEDQSAESQFVRRIKGCIHGLGQSDRDLLLDLARKLANR